MATCAILAALLFAATGIAYSAARRWAFAERRVAELQAELRRRNDCRPKAKTRADLMDQFARDLDATDRADPRGVESALPGDYPPYYGGQPSTTSPATAPLQR